MFRDPSTNHYRTQTFIKQLLKLFLSLQVAELLEIPHCAIYRVYTKEWGGFKSEQEIYFSSYKGTTYTVSSGNCPSFSCATSSSLFMLTAGPRGQFPRWRRRRKTLSVCSVLRCPDLWLPCSVSFVHGLEKTHHAWCVFSKPCHLGNWPRGPAVNMRSELLVAHEKLGQLPLLTVYVVSV